MAHNRQKFLAVLLVALSVAACTPPFDRYMLEGQAAMDKNEFEKARATFHKAVLEGRRSTKSKANLLAALEAEAVCAEALKQYDDEIKLLAEAAKACKADPALGPVRAAKVEKRMGDIAASQSDNDHAFEYYKAALETLEGAGKATSADSAFIYIALGQMNSNRKSYKEARPYFEKGLLILDEANEPRTYIQKGAALNALANVYRELGMEDQAGELEAQARVSQIGGTRGQIRKMLSGIPR